jgi:hypothetical protein
VGDAAQGRERHAGRLPAGCAHHQPDRAPVEIGPRIAGQVFEQVDRVLDQAGHAAVIAGRSDHHGIGRAHGFDQGALAISTVGAFRIEMGQGLQGAAPNICVWAPMLAQAASTAATRRSVLEPSRRVPPIPTIFMILRLP